MSDKYEEVDAPIVEAELVEDKTPFDEGYEAGVRDMKAAAMDALDDGSECSLWALDVVGSL